MKDHYDVYLEEEHLILRDTLREFIKQYFPPDYVNAMERKKEFPWEVRDKLKELELNWGIPEEYGGIPFDYRAMFLTLEELAKVSVSIARVLIYMGNTTAPGFIKKATDEVKKEIYPKQAANELIWAFGMTEAGGGTDLLNNVRTTAIEDGDYFVVNGEKMFTTVADIADYMLILCVTDPETNNPMERFSTICVDMKSEGIDVQKLDKLSLQPISSCIVGFHDVKVPKKMLVGKQGRGYPNCLNYVSNSKLLNAAEALGNAEAAYAEAAEHSKIRKSYGHPIGRYQMTQHKLVHMEMDIRAAKLLGYHTAYLADHNKEWLLDAMIAEKFTGEAGVNATTYAMEIFGGYGLMKDYNLERYFRDARLFITAGYSGEMKTMQIAKLLGFPHAYADVEVGDGVKVYDKEHSY